MICSQSGISARAAAQQFGFAQVATDPDAVFSESEIDLVFVVTPHENHAEQTIRALKSGKAVFVEKPLAVNREELEEVTEAYRAHPQPLIVGFNRRFAPLSVRLREYFDDRVEPLAIHYRVLAGRIPAESPWQDPASGGRIVGELCHFIDYCRFLVGKKVVRISAEAAGPLAEKSHPPDNLQVLMKFADGSIATVSYLSAADPGPGKEEVTVTGEGRTAILNDFRQLECHHKGEIKSWKGKQDKGHEAELKCVLEKLKSGTAMPIPFDELCEVTELTFAVQDALSLGETI
jgi:polar amino acid transport system substrate-binding protein